MDWMKGPKATPPAWRHAAFKGFSVINTYIPQGYLLESPKYAYKLEWFKRLRRYFEKKFTPQDPVLWCGDLNVAPRDLDVHHPEKHLTHVCFHEDAKKAYAHTLAWGFEDVFLKLYPGKQQFTFWDYRFRSNGKSSLEANLGWRIDHIFGHGTSGQALHASGSGHRTAKNPAILGPYLPLGRV